MSNIVLKSQPYGREVCEQKEMKFVPGHPNGVTNCTATTVTLSTARLAKTSTSTPVTALKRSVPTVSALLAEVQDARPAERRIKELFPAERE